MTQHQPGDILLYTDEGGHDVICYIAEIRASTRSLWYWTVQLRRIEDKWVSSIGELSQHQIDGDTWKALEPLTIMIRYGEEPEAILNQEKWHRQQIGHCNAKISDTKVLLQGAKRRKVQVQEIIRQVKGLPNGQANS